MHRSVITSGFEKMSLFTLLHVRMPSASSADEYSSIPAFVRRSIAISPGRTGAPSGLVPLSRSSFIRRAVYSASLNAVSPPPSASSSERFALSISTSSHGSSASGIFLERRSSSSSVYGIFPNGKILPDTAFANRITFSDERKLSLMNM